MCKSDLRIRTNESWALGAALWKKRELAHLLFQKVHGNYCVGVECR